MTTLPPLADRHRHLDGSLRASTLIELARAQGLSLPEVPRFQPGMGLHEALACFATTLSVLQHPDAVRRVAAEICEDASREGVSSLEIRFGPQLHAGAEPAAIVDAALEGIAGRAGLILCGLYGESPERFESHVELAASRPGIVGLDLAGGPLPSHRFGMRDYAPAFRQAAAIGLGTTVHAGEGRAPAEIATAIEVLGARRIGHGTTLADDPGVLRLVVESGVTIEACITSNVHVNAIARPEDHPIGRWLDAGVRVAICTDNTLLSAVDAQHEHSLASRLPGMSPEKVALAIAHGHASAFRRGHSGARA